MPNTMMQLSLFPNTEHAAPDEHPDNGFLNFNVFHKENPEIYDLFKKEAFKHIYEESTEKMGARMIIDSIRWGMAEQGKGHVTISNNHIAYCTRMFRRDYPKYKGVFDIRPLQNLANEIALTEIIR